jgi:hypothetical protein
VAGLGFIVEGKIDQAIYFSENSCLNGLYSLIIRLYRELVSLLSRRISYHLLSIMAINYYYPSEFIEAHSHPSGYIRDGRYG